MSPKVTTPKLPLIIGHRGASALAPENTIASFVRAFQDGADGIEFDVRLARDQVPVVIHDRTLRRTGRVAGAVSDFTAAELARVDAGSWFNRRYPDQAQSEYERETIPSLEQLFTTLAETDGLFYLEMKCENGQPTPLATAVVKSIRQLALVERVIVESFDLSVLAEVKRIDPAIRVAALFESRIRRPLAGLKIKSSVDLAFELGAAEVALHYDLVSDSLVGKASRLGLATVVWTVDDPQWISRAQRFGIKALITNKPGKMVQARAKTH